MIASLLGIHRPLDEESADRQLAGQIHKLHGLAKLLTEIGVRVELGHARAESEVGAAGDEVHLALGLGVGVLHRPGGGEGCGVESSAETKQFARLVRFDHLGHDRLPSSPGGDNVADSVGSGVRDVDLVEGIHVFKSVGGCLKGVA